MNTKAPDLTKVERMTLEAAIDAGPSSSASVIYLHLPERAVSFAAAYIAIEMLAVKGLLRADDLSAIPRLWSSNVSRATL